MNMKAFSTNIIFVDTEFSTLDPYKGELLSIGMVKPTGEELYIELKHDGNVSDWVRENILDDMKEPKLSRDETKRAVYERRIADLERLLGKKEVEIALLKNFLGQIG